MPPSGDSNLFNRVELHLHCSMDFINCLFSQLMRFCCPQFIRFCHQRRQHCLFSKSTLCFVTLLQCIIRFCKGYIKCFCWFTGGENSQNARTAPIPIPSMAVSPAVFPSSGEQSRIGAQFTASVLMMPLMSFPCQKPLFNEWNGLGKYWRPGYHGTDVN